MPTSTKPTRPKCQACLGTGREQDPKETGAKMRKAREKSGQDVKSVAGRMKISTAYLSDLERGNRRWTLAIMESFQAALAAGANPAP